MAFLLSLVYQPSYKRTKASNDYEEIPDGGPDFGDNNRKLNANNNDDNNGDIKSIERGSEDDDVINPIFVTTEAVSGNDIDVSQRTGSRGRNSRDSPQQDTEPLLLA